MIIGLRIPKTSEDWRNKGGQQGLIVRVSVKRGVRLEMYRGSELKIRKLNFI